jgi:hypothetical protein
MYVPHCFKLPEIDLFKGARIYFCCALRHFTRMHMQRNFKKDLKNPNFDKKKYLFFQKI